MSMTYENTAGRVTVSPTNGITVEFCETAWPDGKYGHLLAAAVANLIADMGPELIRGVEAWDLVALDADDLAVISRASDLFDRYAVGQTITTVEAGELNAALKTIVARGPHFCDDEESA